jgi:hypothetical protein
VEAGITLRSNFSPRAARARPTLEESFASLSLEDLRARLQAPAAGLTQAEARARLARYGCDELLCFLMPPLGWGWAAFVRAFALVWFLLNDRVKLAAYRFLDSRLGAAPEINSPEAFHRV